MGTAKPKKPRKEKKAKAKPDQPPEKAGELPAHEGDAAGIFAAIQGDAANVPPKGSSGASQSSSIKGPRDVEQTPQVLNVFDIILIWATEFWILQSSNLSPAKISLSTREEIGVEGENTLPKNFSIVQADNQVFIV